MRPARRWRGRLLADRRRAARELHRDAGRVLGHPRIPELGDGPFETLSCFNNNVCGLGRDGTITCPDSGAVRDNAPEGGGYTAIAVGAQYACALDAGGAPVCWGMDVHGFGTMNAPPGWTFEGLSAGFNNTCGITADDELVCWGIPMRFAL